MNIIKVNAARVKYLVDTLVKLLYVSVVANNMVALFDKFFSRHNHKIWLIEIPTRDSEDLFRLTEHWFGLIQKCSVTKLVAYHTIFL